MRKAFEFLKSFFRTQLVVVAISGYVFFVSAAGIAEAYRADAPHYMVRGEDGELIRQVSRQDYLRHEVGSGAFMLLMAMMFWGLAAYSLQETESESKKEIDLLKCKLAELEKEVASLKQ